MRIVTQLAALVAAIPLICVVGFATAQECRQTFADIQIQAAEVGDIIVADLHDEDAQALAAMGRWRHAPPPFDELVIVRGGPHYDGPTPPHLFLLLRDDCVVAVLPAVTTPEQIDQALTAVLGTDT